MVKRNKYKRTINGRTYYVHIFEAFLHTTVAIRDNRWTGRRTKTYLKKRKWFCDDVESFAAETLSHAVEGREQSIKDEEEYDERIERVLDIVEREYECTS